MSTTAKPNTQATPLLFVLLFVLLDECCLLFGTRILSSVLPLGNFERSTTWSRLTARVTIWHVHDTSIRVSIVIKLVRDRWGVQSPQTCTLLDGSFREN